MQSKMKILVSALYFHPDHSGIALYSSDLAWYFAEQGHDVTVVTGFPFYPKWLKAPADRHKLFRQERERGVRILRGYLYVPHHVTTLKRILHDISFTLFALLNFIRAGRQDCIVILSPPLLLGVIGVIFKYLWQAQLVFHVQDFQTDAAQSLGMLQQSWLIKALTKVEQSIYHHSTWVATITKGMWKLLVDKGVDKGKLEIFYNWIDISATVPKQQFAPFLCHYPQYKNKFTVAYAGNIGIKQGLDVLIYAAEMMQNDDSVHFLIIGEGADKARIEQLAQEKHLTNVTFLPFLSQSDYYAMLDAINVSFVAQRPQTGNVFFPSKLLGIMAVGKPLLISADLNSELAITIADAHCGLVAAAENIETLVQNIRRLRDEPALCAQLGSNGIKKVQEFERSTVLAGFMQRIMHEHIQKNLSHQPSQQPILGKNL
ncbi:MAG: glycosyltransferase family 4 protein [Caldilineaceae bacterium]